MNIMVIAPHPDDAELSIGGTIINLALKKHNVYMLNLTNGEPTPKGSVEIRLKETKEADKILKIKKRIIMDMPNRYLLDKIVNREKVAEHIRTWRPDILLAPYHLDAHPDHISASSLSISARFYAKLTKTSMKGESFYSPRILFYYSVHLRLSINPTFILPVSADVFVKKIKAIQVYQSQFSYGKNKKIPEYVKAIGKYFGALINTDYAEPFYTPEVLGIKDLNCLL